MIERFQKEKRRQQHGCLVTLFVVLFILFLIACPPYFEMRTFNKFKSDEQPSATYLDALFSELRIESQK